MTATIFHYDHPVTVSQLRNDSNEAMIAPGRWVPVTALRTDHPEGITAAIRETAIALLPTPWARDVAELAFEHNATSVQWLDTAAHVMFFTHHARNAFEAAHAASASPTKITPHGAWDFIAQEA